MSLSPLLAAVMIAGSMLALVLTRQPLLQVSHYTGPSAVAAAPAPPVARGGGLSAPVAPPPGQEVRPVARSADGPLSVVGLPTVDVATIRRVLQQYNSPAIQEAEAIYQLGLDHGIDPAICLAFFIVESSAGTRGMATETLSMGNIRATPGYVNHKGYRKYATWRASIEDWYQLITRLYIGEWGLTTVEAIVPVYAPAADSNHPERYIQTVRRLVHGWRARP